MTWVAGVFDNFYGRPLTPPGIEVLDGRELCLSGVLGRTHYPLFFLNENTFSFTATTWGIVTGERRETNESISSALWSDAKQLPDEARMQPVKMLSMVQQ